MKKHFLSVMAVVGLVFQSYSQAFFESVTFTGALPPVGSGSYTAKIEGGFTQEFTSGDWTDGWVEWFPNQAVYRTGTEVIQGDVTSDRVIAGDAILRGIVHVTNGATLKFNPGAHIRCELGSALIIAKGAKIDAVGTRTAPIIFTSSKAPGTRTPGDWSGILLIGNSQVNTASGKRQYEALPNDPLAEYGGGRGAELNLADNSGEMRFCRIEFAGFNYLPDQELNGLTLGACGTGTRVNFIQVSYARDDAFEWFGGTSNHKYLVALGAVDDDFDMDEGYAGKVQFGIAVKDPAVFETAAGGTSNGFEHDNNTGVGTPSAVVPGVNDPKPNTAPILSHITVIGPWVNRATTSGNKFGRGLEMRSGVATSLYNSIVTGYTTLAALQHPSTTVTPSTAQKILKAQNDSQVASLDITPCEYVNVHLLSVAGAGVTYTSAPNIPAGVTFNFASYMNGTNRNSSAATDFSTLFANRITNFTTSVAGISYRPTAASPVASVVATYTGIIAPFTAAPEVIAAQPFASVNRSVLLFGSKEVGDSFSPISFVVNAANLTGSGVSISSSSADFTVNPTTIALSSGSVNNVSVAVNVAKTTAGAASGNIVVNFGDSRVSNVTISASALLVAPASPIIAVDVAELSFTPIETTTSATYTSLSKPVAVTARNLTADITVTAPTGYQVSLSPTADFASTVTLTRAANRSVNTTVHVRLNSTVQSSTNAGELTFASTGATTKTVELSANTAANVVLSSTSPRIDVFNGQVVSSTSAAFNIRGDRLPANIVITPNSPDIEVSVTSSSAGFGATATLATTGQITSTANNVWVRYKGMVAPTTNGVQVGTLSITGVQLFVSVSIRLNGLGGTLANRWILIDGGSPVITALGFNFNAILSGTPDLNRANNDLYIGRILQGGLGTNTATLTGNALSASALPYPLTFTGTISTDASSNIVTGSGTNFALLPVGLPIHKIDGTLLGRIASTVSGTELTLEAPATSTETNINFVTSAILFKRSSATISVSPGSPLAFNVSGYTSGVPNPVTQVITITGANHDFPINVGINPALTASGAMFELSLGATPSVPGALSVVVPVNANGTVNQTVAIRYVPNNVETLSLPGLQVNAAHSTELLILGNNRALTAGVNSADPRATLAYNLRGNAQATLSVNRTSFARFLTYENVPSGVQKISITGSRVRSAIQISAPANFQLSTSNDFTGATNTLNITTTGTSVAQEINIRYLRTSSGTDNGILSIQLDGVAPITLNLSGEAVGVVPFINAVNEFASNNITFPGMVRVTVNGTNLVGKLTATASSNFGVSLTESGTPASFVELTPDPSDIGDVAATVVYLTYQGTGVQSGTLTFSSPNATSVVIDLTGGATSSVVKKSETQGQIAVYPNPTEGDATLAVDFVNTENITVDVFNVMGSQTVASFSDTVYGLKTYPLTGLSKGIYIVRVAAGNTVKTAKLVVK